MTKHKDVIAGADEEGMWTISRACHCRRSYSRSQTSDRRFTRFQKAVSLKREQLAEIIKEKSLAWAIGRADVAEIDQYNILRASLLALQRAVMALSADSQPKFG